MFIERDASAVRALRANLDALGLDDERAQLRRADALAALRTACEQEETYDLVFIDPPYSRAGDWEHELSVLLPALLERGARVVVESDRRAPLQLALQVERERRYGDTTIRIYRQQ